MLKHTQYQDMGISYQKGRLYWKEGAGKEQRKVRIKDFQI